MKATFKIQKTDAKGGWLIDFTSDLEASFQWDPFIFTATRFIALEALKYFGMEATDSRINQIAKLAKEHFDDSGAVQAFTIENTDIQ